MRFSCRRVGGNRVTRGVEEGRPRGRVDSVRPVRVCRAGLRSESGAPGGVGPIRRKGRAGRRRRWLNVEAVGRVDGPGGQGETEGALTRAEGGAAGPLRSSDGSWPVRRRVARRPSLELFRRVAAEGRGDRQARGAPPGVFASRDISRRSRSALSGPRAANAYRRYRSSRRPAGGGTGKDRSPSRVATTAVDERGLMMAFRYAIGSTASSFGRLSRVRNLDGAFSIVLDGNEILVVFFVKGSESSEMAGADLADTDPRGVGADGAVARA